MSLKRMDIIQHRANDLDTIRQAAADGANGVEVDIFMTADEVLVLRHSHRYLGSDVPSQSYSPDMGPTLDSAIELCNELGLDVFAEIKMAELHESYCLYGFQQAVVEALYRVNNLYCVLSFSTGCLFDVHDIDPDMPTIVNCREGQRLPDTEEHLTQYIKGVCAPGSELPWHAAAHSFPLFLYNVEPGQVPEQVRSGIAGVIVDSVRAW